MAWCVIQLPNIEKPSVAADLLSRQDSEIASIDLVQCVINLADRYTLVNRIVDKIADDKGSPTQWLTKFFSTLAITWGESFANRCDDAYDRKLIHGIHRDLNKCTVNLALSFESTPMRAHTIAVVLHNVDCVLHVLEAPACVRARLDALFRSLEQYLDVKGVAGAETRAIISEIRNIEQEALGYAGIE